MTVHAQTREILRQKWSLGRTRREVRGGFRPTAAIAALRAYLRHRETLVQSTATHVQRMQKALVQVNLQLCVADDGNVDW